MCKEDEAHASKFLFFSPMSTKVLDDGLVLYESHAHHISQGEAAVTATTTTLAVGAENVLGVSPLFPWW